MKLLEILPELEEGGVERHVISLSTALCERGHEVHIVSGGGKLIHILPNNVIHRRLPVHQKNPISILFCAWQIANLVRREDFHLIHAHARVPAWAAHIASNIAGVPFVVTAHCNFGNRSRWLYYPYRQAAKTICVSRSVEQEMIGCFSDNTVIVRNGLPPASPWEGPQQKHARHMLFIGRLSEVKGLQDAIQALAKFDRARDWRLDVLGDGPLRLKLEALTRNSGIADKVFFHGFRDDTDKWLRNCSCLIFPSYREGLSLTLARAIQMGTPIIASDIPSVRELCSTPEILLPPGNVDKWKRALAQFIISGQVQYGFQPQVIPTISEMTEATETVYKQATTNYKKSVMKNN